MVLADGKDDGFPYLATDGVAQRMFEKRLAEKLVGSIGKKALSNSRCL